MRRRRPGCSLSPPKRLFGLESDVAPGKSDVVQVAVAQFGQLAPINLTLPPDAEGFAELREKLGTMMIYHRFMCENGHFHLLKLICCPQYRPYPSFRQTTLCTDSHDINSSIGGVENDRQAALAQRIARIRGRRPAFELYAGGFRAERHADRD